MPGSTPAQVSQRLRGISARWVAAWLAICYGVAACLYVIVSDRLLGHLINDPDRLSQFQTYKTLLLVAVSAALLFEVTHRALRRRGPVAKVAARQATGADRAASLRAHVNVLIAVIALPLVGLTAWLIYAQARDDSLAARHSVLAAARVVASDSGRFFTTTRLKLEAMALRVATGDPARGCDPGFDYFSTLNPEYTVLLLWSVDGRVLCPERHAARRYDDARRPPWLQQVIAARRGQLSEPYRGPLSGRWITVVAEPVIDAGGRMLGALDLSVDLGNFPPVALPVGGGVEMLVVLDGRGRIAASAASQADAGREGGLVAELAGQLRDGHAFGRAGDGVDRIFGIAPVPGTDWQVVAGVPVERVFAKAHQNLVASMLLVLAITLAASYLAYRVSLAIERPIIITARTAQAVAAGNLDVRAPETGPTETRVVARQFNAMLDGRIESERSLERLLAQERAVRAEAEAANGALAALRDDLERQVATRTLELSERNRELESFSYTISHDVRAPLRVIHGYAGLLDDEFGERLGDPGRDMLRHIAGAVQRMDELAEGLMMLSRVTRGEVCLAPFDIGALAREVADGVARGDPARRVDWGIDRGARVRADPTLIRIALDNLIRNAWKYTARVEVASIAFGWSDLDQGERIYHVRDNGAGFDVRRAERLFEPFQRMHDNSEFPGTGIGLATVKRIITRHGGRIWADSAPGAGTTMYFTLPAASPRDGERADNNSKGEGLGDTQS